MDDIGAIRSFTVDAAGGGARLDVFLAGASGVSRTKIKRLIEDGYVLVNDLVAMKPSLAVAPGDEIDFTVPPAEEPRFLPEDIPLDIVYEDRHLLVVNKPAGMVVHPGAGNVTGTPASALLFHCREITRRGGAFRPGIVHRLDRDTSGLLVVALDDETHEALSRMIADRAVTRVYTACVWGHPRPGSGIIDAPIDRHPKYRTLRAVVPGGRPANTRYETYAQYRFLSRLTVTLGTGRTHQIRVHLAHIGHHVFGDPIYGGRDDRLKGFSPEIRLAARKLLEIMPRQALHAGHLSFVHPVTGAALSFTARPPGDMLALEEALEREPGHATTPEP